MVGDYPAAAALRRRAARMEANGQVQVQQRPPRHRHTPLGPYPRTRRSHSTPSQPAMKLSTLYLIVSFCLALLAIISSSSSPNMMDTTKNVMDNAPTEVPNDAKKSHQQDFDIVKSWNALFSSTTEQQEPTTKSRSVPPLFRWMLPPVKEEHQEYTNQSFFIKNNPFIRLLSNVVDPTLLHPHSSTATDVIDKILTSTPRILAIANLLLALTYLLHSFVANLFLGQDASRILLEGQTDIAGARGTTTIPASSWAAGRERLGGYLVFKLLLISAVVAPDTLDLLILLSWYTLLSFLRSLAQLCAATTAHSASSGLTPSRGVLYLLLLVLFLDVLAAAFCVALFHGAGWGMVLLLTCDCALLAINVLAHALQHVSQVLEESHSVTIRELEERQVHVHSTLHDYRNQNAPAVVEDENEIVTADQMTLLQQESRELDRLVALYESSHARQVQILDAICFGLQLLVHFLTVVHFLHIWSLHGLQFTLIDGVLALHLHSATSAFLQKIAERRNLNRIARDLNDTFQDASEVEMRKADNDVCCICLVPMTTGHAKRVGCGHFYHTHCLREVVERARSIEAAKCPLCRASLLDGRQGGSSNGGGGGNNAQQDATVNETAVAAAAAANIADGQEQPRAGEVVIGRPPSPPLAAAAGAAVPPPGEHALFRFSTENILPAWLPLPAFSFEVVRRPPAAVEAAAGAAAAAAAPNNDVNAIVPDAADRNAVQPSFLRRLLIMAGAIPMSPEEVAMYLDQLVDMFPQYDRADLLRELRMRGSSEAVVEAVLMGIFTGVPRGGGGSNGALQQDQEVVLARQRRNENVIDEEEDEDDDDDDDTEEEEEENDDEQ